MKNIRSKKDLETLKRRYLQSGISTLDNGFDWLDVIQGCIDSQGTSEPFGMDETDYENTPRELRKLWKGLK